MTLGPSTWTKAFQKLIKNKQMELERQYFEAHEKEMMLIQGKNVRFQEDEPNTNTQSF